MNYLKILLCTAMILKFSSANSQEISSHQWKDRVILILVDDLNIQVYQNQIIALQENKKGINERKLIVYHIKPTEYKLGLKSSKWQKSKNIYSQYKKNDAPFEVILIGLDGSIKLHQTEFLSCEKLFATIDAMPMRKTELNQLEKRN